MKQLVISVLGKDRPGLINNVTDIAAKRGLNIADSRMTVLGGEFAIIMLIEGEIEQLNELSAGLNDELDALGLSGHSKLTAPSTQGDEARPYKIEVDALDHPGIVAQISGYFSKHDINIEDLDTGTYAAAHTGSKMFRIKMIVRLGADVSAAKVRDDFLDYCDSLNLDAIFESYR